MKNTKVTIAGVEFKNPVMTASGTFGSGMEYSEFVDLNCLGAVVTKEVNGLIFGVRYVIKSILWKMVFLNL